MINASPRNFQNSTSKFFSGCPGMKGFGHLGTGNKQFLEVGPSNDQKTIDDYIIFFQG